MEKGRDIRRIRKGRPSISEDKKRTHRVTVGFNDAEYATLESIQRKCPDETRQEIIRKAILGIHPVSTIGKEQWQSLSRPLANLNQITHHINSGKIVDSCELKSCLKDTERSIREIRHALRGGIRNDTKDN